ncbi:hypothetical protein B0H63DRAFT_481396 [Podospora didyma]|uniref:Secreted protein n=1 Tax=Podospora didyma TaxID=330526 RepID=A0AAE0KEC7_9PEZI|nr:hypothetical protein B0H63DRAFT_481396 [Podospora didyma]
MFIRVSDQMNEGCLLCCLLAWFLKSEAVLGSVIRKSAQSSDRIGYLLSPLSALSTASCSPGPLTVFAVSSLNVVSIC